MADPKVFIEQKIAALQSYSADVQAMDVSEDSLMLSEFKEAITEVMYRIEGISHFTIENFYTFDYLNDKALAEKPSFESLTEEWHSTFAGYDAILLKQLKINQAKLTKAEEENSELDMSHYVEDRVSNNQ